MIRPVKDSDTRQISDIYNHFVNHTIVTFDEEEVTDKEMSDYIQKVQEKYPWLVYEEQGAVAGYAYAGSWKSRCAYRYSVETTIYLRPEEGGRGLGTQLYGELIRQVREMGIHSAIGGIALPNPASIRLHEKLGFQKIGHFREVGFKFDKWIDVGYWELIL
jgi:L-amino acid N-acyltransferase YncA